MALDTLQFKSKAQAVCELIRQRILDFHYVPGQALLIDGLARELGVSKIPIREAIKQLEAERLVEVVLHVGARVAPISVSQAEQIYPIRHALGDLGVRLAVDRLDDATLGYLEDLQCQMEESTRARDTATVDRLNRAFHLRIVEASGNPELYQLYRDLMHRCSRFRAGVTLGQRRAIAVMAEHRAILGALRSRDVVSAVRASNEHERRSAEEIVHQMRLKEMARDAG
ncbi:MAG: GntR family transcriptional regulator [Chloroflexota bacterium]